MKKNQIKILDDLWRIAIKKQAGNKCEFSGKPLPKGFNPHHIVPRGNYRTRWEPLNGVGLTYQKHIQWAHKDTTAFTEWIKQVLGEKDYWKLQKMRNEIYDGSIQTFEYYKKILKKVKRRDMGSLKGALTRITAWGLVK